MKCGSVFVMRVLFACSILAIASSEVHAQRSQYIYTNWYSLDCIQDASVAASGESFVAKTGEPEAVVVNPATLASVSKYSIEYSHRSYPMADFNIGYGGARVTAPFSFGTFSFSYRRRQFDIDLLVSTEQYPEGIGEEHIEESDWTYALSYARNITPWLAAGATLSLFNSFREFSGVDGLALVTNVDDKKPLLMDIGLVGHLGGISTNSRITDQFSTGIALQNFGTDYAIRDEQPNLFVYDSSAQHYLTVGSPSYLIPIPRYVRLGFEYIVRVAGATDDALKPIEFSITGAYYKILNLPDRQESDRERYSLGGEMKLFEVVSVQGGTLRPASFDQNMSYYPLRWSAGINVPCRRLDTRVPLNVAFRYGEMPTYNPYFHTVPVKFISLRLEYDPGNP